MTDAGADAQQPEDDAGQSGEEKPEPRIAPRADVVKTVVERYYTRGVDAADRTRQHSERGYTIASAIAATLVAAGLLTHLEERPVVVQVLGLVSLGLWLLAALLFMWAVAFRVSVPEPEAYKNEGEFVTGIGKQLRQEIRVLNRRLNWALATTVTATVMTISALGYATAEPGGSTPVRARVELTPAADKAVAKLCGRPVSFIYATVNPDALSHASVPLGIPAGECGPQATVERVPKDAIVATEDVFEFPTFPPG